MTARPDDNTEVPMAPTPVRHPLRDAEAVRRRAIAAHPAGRGRSRHPLAAVADGGPAGHTPPRTPATPDGEDGSMTTEYGLIVVVGATACSLVIKWASGGAVFELLGGVLDAARGLVGF